VVLEERRTFERGSAGFPAVIVVVDEGGRWRQVSAVVVDISVGGLRLCAEEALRAGERVQVMFDLPDAHEPIEATLQALACEPTAADEFTVRGKFTDLEGETILRIARWTLAESRRGVR
jgi:hypothetical protein